MFSTQNTNLEKLYKIPQTLADISVDIFGGICTRRNFLHKMRFTGQKGENKTPYMCLGLCKPVEVEEKLVYPYVSGNASAKYVIPPANFHFLLPYKFSKGKARVLSPSELKSDYPLTYKRVLEFKKEFNHNDAPLYSADYYSVQGRKLLEYLGTPKIIVNEYYGLQAAFDPTGQQIFEEGCGIVLKDPKKYNYVTAVLNSPLAKQLPALCRLEELYFSALAPEALRHFPIVFPENKETENLISTLSGYLGLLQNQKYAEKAIFGTSSRYDELTVFYKNLTDFLIMDTYLTNDLDPEFLEILKTHIPSIEGFEGSSKSGYEREAEAIYIKGDKILNELRTVRQNILKAPDLEKCRFGGSFTNVLNGICVC
ncbi:MAG: hypothetical protein PHD26_02975 [Methanosarcinaceae archaeon]|nr:hypothetical protein [Methanosarcinaceae archaeon]